MTTEFEKLVLRLESFERQIGFLQDENQQLKLANIKFEQTITKQGQEIVKLRELVEKLVLENKRLTKENERLRNQLSKYKNENTPAGAMPPYLKDELKAMFPPEKDIDAKDKGKEAHLPNHRNERPKPDKTKTHKIKRCPRCDSRLTPLETKRRRIVIHLVMPSAETAEHVSEGGYCTHCKERFYAPVPDTLPNSKYSLDIAIFIVMMLVIYNGTERKIAKLLRSFGIQISAASVNNVYHSVRDYLGEKKYREFENELKNSVCTNGDETSNRDRGKTGWTWLVANARTVFIRIENSRSAKIAKKLPIGKFGVFDGYRAYDKAAKRIQRSWAKVSTRARTPKYYFDEEWQVEQYKSFVNALFKIYHDAKHTKERGNDVKEHFDKRLKELLLIPRREESNLLRLTNYICGYEGEWFTALLRKGIPLTNNRAEQQLRPIVIKRKISQHTWSEHGKKCLEVFYSIAQTCELRDENFADVIRHEIESNLAEMRKS